MNFIDLCFDIIKDIQSRDGVDEWGEMEQTMLMTFSKLTQNYFSNYEKIRRVLKFMIDQFITTYK
jgi:hypothetical protein